jgi:cobalt/nickel transport system ATP-binding protein
MTTFENLIQIKDLYFGYNHGIMILDGLNFSLKSGDKIGIIGANGSGKTTLFHIIMGLLKPLSGEINIFGKQRREEKDFFEVRQKIGLLFQDSDDQLFYPTVEEDIAFGPLNLGKSHEDAKIVVKNICTLLGLSGMEKKITYRLSGGEKRLVALAAVVAMNPACFLLDEPTSGLDEDTTDKFLNYLKSYSETYVIITHDHEFLKKAVKQIYAIQGGKITLKETL